MQRLSQRFSGALCLGALLVALPACDQADPMQGDPVRGRPAGSLDRSTPFFAAREAGEWEWIGASGENPVPGGPGDIGMMCRDGSATGFGFRPGSEEDVLLFLKGGGFCYDGATCSLSPSHFDSTDFDRFASATGTRGIFDSENPENPFAGWSAIYVPYCTGDVHAGNATDRVVSGAGTQQFVGYRNLERVLAAMDGRLASRQRVVLAGTSAGGYGTVLTYGLVASAFAPTPVHLLNDSGALPRDNRVLLPEQQQAVRDLWSLGEALKFASACTACTRPNGDGLEYVLPFYAYTYSDRHFGYISYLHDGGGPFADALIDLRSVYVSNGVTDSLPNIGTYYADGRKHTFLLDDRRFYDTEIVTASTTLPLSQWLHDVFVDQASPYHADPDSIYAPGACCAP